MNTPQVPAEGWSSNAFPMPAVERPFNAFSTQAVGWPMNPPQPSATGMSVNRAQPPAARMPRNAPQPPAAEIRRKRGRPFGAITKVHHPKKSEEQLAKEKKKREEVAAGKRQQTAAVPGLAPPPPDFGAMADVDALQILETSSVPTPNSSRPIITGDADATGIPEASPAPRLSPPAPGVMNDVDHLAISDQPLASLPSDYQNDLVTMLEPTQIGNKIRSGHNHVGHGDVTSWVREAERRRDAAAAEEGREKTMVEELEESQPGGITRLRQVPQVHQTHYHPCSCKDHHCSTNLIMRYGDGTIDTVVLTAPPYSEISNCARGRLCPGI